ncbi:hypothetical protein U1Q18_000462 [Sarracenia purpurea var. burkii]
MNEPNPGNNLDAPPNIPPKRKRGRPRKDASQTPREVAWVPPGFQVVKGNQPFQLDAIEDANNGIVGQVVTGVVEGAFDAGYLLTVRIGDSNTRLSGVVFKPGHYVPISAENDVAPHVRMIRRNEVPFPMGNQTGKRRNGQHRNRRRVETGYLLNGLAPPANMFASQNAADLVASKGKQVSPVSNCASPLVGSRGTVVPVVLQPVILSNGLLPTNQVPPLPSQAVHLAASPKHTPVQTFGSQVQLSQTQTSNHVKLEGVNNENGHLHQVVKPVKHTETRMEDKVGGKASVEDSGHRLEGDIEDINEPLFVEPLQTIHTNIRNLSEFVPKPSEHKGIGRMSELLQALQENMTEIEAPRVENIAIKKDVGDEENVRSNT